MRKSIGYFDHDCDLPVIIDYRMAELPPFMPAYQRWFFSLRKFFLVDEESKKAKRFFRSYASLRDEKIRHASGDYSRIIHPLSKFAIYKDKILCILWLFSFLIDPVRMSFFMDCDNKPILIRILFALDAVLFLNIILSCFVGYYNNLTKEIILCPKRIIKDRMISFFIPELLACVPVKEFVIVIMKTNLKTSHVPVIGILRCFRFVRVMDVTRYLSEIMQEKNIPESVKTLAIVFLMAFFLIHWSGCILYFISNGYYTFLYLPDKSWIYDEDESPTFHDDLCSGFSKEFFQLVVMVYIRSTCHFFGASGGYKSVVLTIEELSLSFVIIIGFFFCMYAMTKVLELFGTVNISESKYEELIHQVTEYVRSKNISDKLRKRLVAYYEYKFQKKFFKEEEIMSTLTEHLRCEVTMQTCKKVLDRVPLLNGMSRATVGSIIGFLQREIYLPNDVILKCGEPLLKMFWISHGTLAVYYGPEATEIMHFEDGDHFGDLSITRKGGLAKLSVVALEITEVFTLARKDVRHCTTFIKEMSEKVMKVGKEKAYLYNMLSTMMSNKDNKNKILADLRKGRILEKDRFRKKGKSLMMRRQLK